VFRDAAASSGSFCSLHRHQPITTCKLYEQTAEPASVFLRVSSSPFVSTTLPVLLHGGHLTDEEEPSNSDVERSIQWGNFQFDCF
jgi:hypothetical protein